MVILKIEKQKLLSKYEEIIGYSSELFNCEEWSEFEAFCLGYECCQNDIKRRLEEEFQKDFARVHNWS